MRGVVKRFGDHTVLDQLDLDVPANEKLALIGPSGSGKSTILRVLMTLEAIDAGIVEIQGERDLAKVRSHVGMVFQQFNLFPHMTVLRNVTEAPIHVLKEDAAQARARAMDLLRMVGLEDRAEARPAQLSGGQQQRVAIARALAMRPRIMLFDEVTSALDPELVGEVLGVMRRLASEGNMTMLIVTHQMDFAREIADRIVFLHEGRILEHGPPSRILDAPEHERTRRFVKALRDR
ncbi:MAG: amino acid ABC transporter ATP-binding protein [Proteobacteria bacterium]|nr:amino acid ABC transporter ATP-binding protein [Pseudomonadota bacterium]